MSDHPKHPLRLHTTHRVEALSDGVFAIAMTVLVFDLKLPNLVHHEDLPAVLIGMWPNFLIFLTTFVLLGIYWQIHRSQYQFIEHADHTLYLLNILLLAFVSLLPFTSNLLGRYVDQPISLVFYGANLVAVGVSLWAHWAYATTAPDLANGYISPAVVRYGSARSLFAPCSYLPAIGFAFVHPTLSLVLYACVPILYIFPGIQRYWYRFADCEEVAKRVDA